MCHCNFSVFVEHNNNFSLSIDFAYVVNFFMVFMNQEAYSNCPFYVFVFFFFLVQRVRYRITEKTYIILPTGEWNTKKKTKCLKAKHKKMENLLMYLNVKH